MELREENKEYTRLKLTQAREAYEDAKGLLADGAELSYVVNSLYYAFYYPALALLHTKGVPPAMQSVSISLFEREFVAPGFVERRFFQALRKAFDLKPKCSAPGLTMITRPETEALLMDAKEFLGAMSRETGLS
jgi:uncharacterized protein (UPF0332 family)